MVLAHFVGCYNILIYDIRSVAYLAPEMLKTKGHGKAVDCYLL